jgi:ABC-2 type transport system permease protein
VHLAGTRDVGAGIVPDRVSSRPHPQLLGGPTALAVRLVRPAVTSWWVAIAVSGLLFGLIARSAGGTISRSSVQQVLSKLGARGNGTDAVLGACFLILAVLVAFAGAGQITAARSEESAGRLDHLLTRPVSRSRWLGGRLLVTVVVLLASSVMAGVFAWAGAASQHAGVSLPALAGAGVNLVPPAITIAGIGVLALGVWPRGTSIVLYALLAWSLLVVVIGGIGATSHWVLDTSVFHQMASAPAVPPHWEADGVMAAIGVVSALIGGIAFKRRDLRGA